MLKLKQISGLLVLSLIILALSGCGIKQQKNNESESNAVSTEAMAKFQQEKSELLAKANAELSAINKKILACNDKIKKGTKLTAAQNEALDEFEKKRASINKRIHEIKNVSIANWDSFKEEFETDLNDASADIEKILTEM